MTVHDPEELKSRLEQLTEELPFKMTSRPMMGGFIGYADGRTFVFLSTGGLGLKLVPPARNGRSPDPEEAMSRRSAHQRSASDRRWTTSGAAEGAGAEVSDINRNGSVRGRPDPHTHRVGLTRIELVTSALSG